VLKCLLFYKFIIFIGTNLLIVAKVHNLLFYTLLCRKYTNIGENSSLRHYLEFHKICPAEHFFNIDPHRLEDYVKLKSDQHESCGEFQGVRFRVKKRPKRSPQAPVLPRLLKGTEPVSGFRKLVTWWTQTLAI
jgi:hypothetical protein